MKDPLLSILIPVYNTSKSLSACLESVFAQDIQDLEIICVDDGSTDDSLSVLQKLAERDSRVRIIRHAENGGLLKARRTGVENASGEYIMFLDSDDAFDAELCRTAVEQIRSRDLDILQFSTRLKFLQTGRNDFIEPPEEVFRDDEILANHFISMKASTSLVVKIYRTALVKQAFSEIPDIRCYVGEDVLTSFFISYFASSYAGVRTKPKYIYYFGSGVSTENSMPLQKYQLYCDMSRFPEIVKAFLDRQNADEAAYLAMKHMVYRLVSDCCKNYALVREEDKDKAWAAFWQAWSQHPFFPDAMKYTISGQDDVIREIKNSESYRIGNAVINPLLRIKNELFPR